LWGEALNAGVKDDGGDTPRPSHAQGQRWRWLVLIEAGADVDIQGRWQTQPLRCNEKGFNHRGGPFLMDRGASLHIKAVRDQQPRQPRANGHKEVAGLDRRYPDVNAG
jgi:hypothetical protein